MSKSKYTRVRPNLEYVVLNDSDHISAAVEALRDDLLNAMNYDDIYAEGFFTAVDDWDIAEEEVSSFISEMFDDDED